MLFSQDWRCFFRPKIFKNIHVFFFLENFAPHSLTRFQTRKKKTFRKKPATRFLPKSGQNQTFTGKKNTIPLAQDYWELKHKKYVNYIFLNMLKYPDKRKKLECCENWFCTSSEVDVFVFDLVLWFWASREGVESISKICLFISFWTKCSKLHSLKCLMIFTVSSFF